MWKWNPRVKAHEILRNNATYWSQQETVPSWKHQINIRFFFQNEGNKIFTGWQGDVATRLPATVHSWPGSASYVWKQWIPDCLARSPRVKISHLRFIPRFLGWSGFAARMLSSTEPTSRNMNCVEKFPLFCQARSPRCAAGDENKISNFALNFELFLYGGQRCETLSQRGSKVSQLCGVWTSDVKWTQNRHEPTLVFCNRVRTRTRTSDRFTEGVHSTWTTEYWRLSQFHVYFTVSHKWNYIAFDKIQTQILSVHLHTVWFHFFQPRIQRDSNTQCFSTFLNKFQFIIQQKYEWQLCAKPRTGNEIRLKCNIWCSSGGGTLVTIAEKQNHPSLLLMELHTVRTQATQAPWMYWLFFKSPLQLAFVFDLLPISYKERYTFSFHTKCCSTLKITSEAFQILPLHSLTTNRMDSGQLREGQCLAKCCNAHKSHHADLRHLWFLLHVAPRTVADEPDQQWGNENDPGSYFWYENAVNLAHGKRKYTSFLARNAFCEFSEDSFGLYRLLNADETFHMDYWMKMVTEWVRSTSSVTNLSSVMECEKLSQVP